MKSAYLLYGLRLKILFQLVRKNGFSFRFKYLLRFILLFQNALWASIFSVVEKIKYKKIIHSTPLPDSPLIIIGHWRTGSTYLHQLLQHDPEGTTLSNFQVTLPDSFLVSEKYYKPVMKFFMGEKFTRPFDNVSIRVDEPQEDEFAILKMCGLSPLKKLIYPDSGQFFLLNYPDFDLQGNEFTVWKDAMTELCKKMKIATSKRIILKNPFHSQRIVTIRKLFPNAKFIHIYRNPLNVIPSTINMWNIVGRQNSMKSGFVQASVKNTVEVFDRMLTYIHEHAKDLPEQSFCEMKFENLEENPVDEIKIAYKKLGLPFTKEFEDAIEKNLIKNFRKNTYSLPEGDDKYIHDKLKHYFEFYGYL
jgi:omega-hydroxy-beta-dihydromenaquinone-9 sulfotransferase